jgi:hypothetical protein
MHFGRLSTLHAACAESRGARQSAPRSRAPGLAGRPPDAPQDDDVLRRLLDDLVAHNAVGKAVLKAIGAANKEKGKLLTIQPFTDADAIDHGKCNAVTLPDKQEEAHAEQRDLFVKADLSQSAADIPIVINGIYTAMIVMGAAVVLLSLATLGRAHADAGEAEAGEQGLGGLEDLRAGRGRPFGLGLAIGKLRHRVFTPTFTTDRPVGRHDRRRP